MSETASKPPSIKVFISSLSANKEVKQQQQRILQTFDVKKIPYDKKDIAVDPQAKREFRMLMRGYNPNGSPPQIFNGDYLCGEYEAFYWATEEERLEEFLRLVPPKKKPTLTTEQVTPSASSITPEQDKQNITIESAAGNNHTADDKEKSSLVPPVPPPPPPVPSSSEPKPTATATPPPPPPPPAPPSTKAANTALEQK